jgi:hypothetical protein
VNIRCKCCGEWFIPSDDSIDLISEGLLSSDTIDTCHECWDLIELSEFDLSESFSDADPEL